MRAGVVLLAGGEATRLPGKLELEAGGLPLVVRAFRRVARDREIVVSAKATFSPCVDALLVAPLVIDRWPRRGPLGGLLTAMTRMRARHVVALAAEAPLLGEWLVEALEEARCDGDEAVVPVHGLGPGRRVEPLAALYDRTAFLHEGSTELRHGGGAVRSVVGRLRARMLAFDDGTRFLSVNTPADYAATARTLAGDEPAR